MENQLPEETKFRSSSRQRMRLALIILSFILYPVTFVYVECPIITEAASKGSIAGCFVSILRGRSGRSPVL
jgi:hypothetical protein